MGTNGYRQAPLLDPFGPELSPAVWSLTKGPRPKEAFPLTDALHPSVNDRPAPAGIQASRLAAKKAERSLEARFESLLSVSVAIATHHDIEGLVSALVTELLPVVDFDAIGMSRYEEATNRVDWHLYQLTSGIERGTIDGTKEETISAWMYLHQKPLIIPFLDR
jgi:formate hydrogenlyase transcriptional activator